MILNVIAIGFFFFIWWVSEPFRYLKMIDKNPRKDSKRCKKCDDWRDCNIRSNGYEIYSAECLTCGHPNLSIGNVPSIVMFSRWGSFIVVIFLILQIFW